MTKFSKTKPKPFRRHYNLKNWLTRHLQVSLSSLGRLYRNPFATLMTIAVIGIAMAMPTGLHTLVINVQTLNHSWEGGASISAFINTGLDEKAAASLAQEIASKPQVASSHFISRAESINEFRQFSGFAGALDVLDENPLPAVILVYPTQEYSVSEKTAELVQELSALPGIDLAQADLEWVKKLHGITQIVQRGALVLAFLLSAAVLLIIGNTIRLEILNRHAEIEINKMVGATDAFIRRPFLYDGFWYGLSGSFIAWLLIMLSFFLIDAPVARLAGLYESNYTLTSLSLSTSVLLLSAGALLGLGGSWIAVSRHLRQIEPD